MAADATDPELEAIRARMRERMVAAPPVPPVSTTQEGVPVEVTDATLDAFAKENPIAVVDVWADWCGPCRLIAPIVDQLAKEWAGKVAFGKLDADTNPRTMGKYGIQGIPSMLVFRNGTQVDMIVGYMPKPQLAARIQAASR